MVIILNYSENVYHSVKVIKSIFELVTNVGRSLIQNQSVSLSISAFIIS